jgi:sarcosine oxidase
VLSCQQASAKPAALLRGDAVHALTRGAIAMPREWDVYRQEDAGVIAADATRAFLLRQAVRWGAKLFHNRRIAAPIEGPTLQIDGEARTFDAVIVAAGAWARALLPEFAGKLAVKRRVVAWFETPTPKLLPVICVDDEDGVYGMPAPRGLYKLGLHAIGGAVNDPDAVREPDAEDARMLGDHARALLPLHNPSPVRMARCLYTVTPDENFLIAQSAKHERVLMFSACSGHGFKFAPAFGELAQEWLDGAH